MTTLYGLRNCDTCRKAINTLKAGGHDIQFVDVRSDGVPADRLTQFYENFGVALVNMRSTTWRGLDDVARATPALELLTQHPTLMKRPVIEHNGTLTLGWGKDVQALF